MIDLTTEYLGLKLKNPLVVSASPLSRSLDNYRKLEDAGVAAIVNESLFEEKINQEVFEQHYYTTQGTYSFAESLTYYPDMASSILGPDEYLKHIAAAKKAVDIPVIGSLNGYSTGGWIKYAQRMEETGADALELNIYTVATEADTSAEDVEKEYLDIVQAVKTTVKIPVAIKMHPFFSCLPHMCRKLDDLGVDGLVLFNRFYQPDIDLDNLEVKPSLILSTPQAMRLPLRWVAILSGQVKASLAATGGIHTASDVIKMLMAGADVTMLCSTLLKNGIKQAAVILNDMKQWLEEREYISVSQMKGSMSQKHCPDPKAFERASYMRTIQSFHLDW